MFILSTLLIFYRFINILQVIIHKVTYIDINKRFFFLLSILNSHTVVDGGKTLLKLLIHYVKLLIYSLIYIF